MANDFFKELKDKIPADKIDEVKDKVEDFVSDKVKDISGDVTEKLSNAIKEKTGSDLNIADSLKGKLFGGDKD